MNRVKLSNRKGQNAIFSLILGFPQKVVLFNILQIRAILREQKKGLISH